MLVNPFMKQLKRQTKLPNLEHIIKRTFSTHLTKSKIITLELSLSLQNQ